MSESRVVKTMDTARRIALLLAVPTAVAVLALLIAGGSFRSADAGSNPVVNTTDDDADAQCDATHCSLREALSFAIAGDTIEFDIDADTDPGCNSGTGICTIKPLTPLPGMAVANLTLDGYTQDGASPNSALAFQPTNADIRIVLDGSDQAGSDFGVWVQSTGATVRGLSIVNFGDEGIKTGTFPDSVIVRGNFIGILPDGETAAGNGTGVHILSSQSGNVIGGNSPADRNVISGNIGHGVLLTGGSGVVAANNFVGTNAAGTSAVPNGGHGMHLQGAPTSLIGISNSGTGNLLSGNAMSGIALTSPDAHDIRVKGNRIGTAANGQDPLPNQDHGVFLDQGSEDNTIGGEFDVDEENLIAFNAKAGVALSPSAGIDNYIDPSSTHSNGGMGTDLLEDNTVLPNDVNDPDTGPNDLMNYPTNISAEWNGSVLSVTATLNSEAFRTYNMFIFVNRECDPSGHGEGERFLASHALQTGSDNTKVFSRNILVDDIADMPFVTMVASNPESTSEFSECEEIEYTGPETPSPSPTLPVTPSPTPTPTPSVTATPTATPIGQTPSPTPTGQTPAPTDTATATPTVTPTPSASEIAWGDVDCTDGISPVDSLKILRADANLSVNKPAECPTLGDEAEVDGDTRTWGDVDCDLAFGPVDSLKVLRFDAGLPVNQEPGCPAMNELVAVG